jgi:putative endonuclease
VNTVLRDKTALDYLNSNQMPVIDRAWSSTEGTIDALFEDHGTLVVVVITSGVYRLLPPRLQRMRRLAVAWMTEHGKRYDRVRVDLVGVTLLPMGQSNIEHIRSVDA